MVDFGSANNHPDSHIIGIQVGCPQRCQSIHEALLHDRHYLQPINYPTVKWGTERLRVSIKAVHTPTMMDDLVYKLKQYF